jgi:hypothetical protein
VGLRSKVNAKNAHTTESQSHREELFRISLCLCISVVKNVGAGTDSKGRLLSDDIFKIDPAKIRDVKVLKTMVGGKWVYEAK